MALSQKLVGFNELGVRLPGILYALGVLGLAVGIAKLFSQGETVYFTALLLIGTPFFIFMARLATTDIGMFFWVSLAIYFWLVSRMHARPWACVLSYGALGAAFMTKGPVTLALYFLAVLPFLFFVKSELPVKTSLASRLARHLTGLVLFCLIALPWYLAVIHKNPGLLNYFIFYQTADRVATTAHHANSSFYFVPILIAAFFPWSFFIPAIVRETLKVSGREKEREYGLWLLSWAFLIFLFFSVIPSKLSSYLLPLSLPLSLICGRYFARKAAPENLTDPWFYRTALASSVVLWAGGIGLGLYAKFFIHERIQGLQPAFLILSCGLSLAGLAGYGFSSFRKARAFLFMLLLTVYASAFVTWWGMTQVGTYKTVKPFAEKILELREYGEPVITYRKMFPGLPFYLKERVIEVGTNTESRFDNPEEVKNYLFPDSSQIGAFIESPRRCFIVARVSKEAELEILYPGKLTRLVSGNKMVLYTNQPVERRASSVLREEKS